MIYIIINIPKTKTIKNKPERAVDFSKKTNYLLIDRIAESAKLSKSDA